MSKCGAYFQGASIEQEGQEANTSFNVGSQCEEVHRRGTNLGRTRDTCFLEALTPTASLIGAWESSQHWRKGERKAGVKGQWREELSVVESDENIVVLSRPLCCPFWVSVFCSPLCLRNWGWHSNLATQLVFYPCSFLIIWFGLHSLNVFLIPHSWLVV